MPRKSLLLAAVSFGLGACATQTGTPSTKAGGNTSLLWAKAEGNSVAIFSSTDKALPCEANIKFTYLDHGERKNGWTSCGYFTSKPGKDVEVCRFTNPALIAPVLDGGVIGGCGQGHESPKP
jgi:hypothetical protein